MTFNFKNIKVEITDTGEVICDDKFTLDILKPIVEDVESNPEQGNPYISAITQVFGNDSITDIVQDDNDMIY